MSEKSDRRETNKLLEYLRIKTVHPVPDYGNLYSLLI